MNAQARPVEYTENEFFSQWRLDNLKVARVAWSIENWERRVSRFQPSGWELGSGEAASGAGVDRTASKT